MGLFFKFLEIYSSKLMKPCRITKRFLKRIRQESAKIADDMRAELDSAGEDSRKLELRYVARFLGFKAAPSCRILDAVFFILTWIKDRSHEINLAIVTTARIDEKMLDIYKQVLEIDHRYLKFALDQSEYRALCEGFEKRLAMPLEKFFSGTHVLRHNTAEMLLTHLYVMLQKAAELVEPQALLPVLTLLAQKLKMYRQFGWMFSESVGAIPRFFTILAPYLVKFNEASRKDAVPPQFKPLLKEVYTYLVQYAQCCCGILDRKQLVVCNLGATDYGFPYPIAKYPEYLTSLASQL